MADDNYFGSPTMGQPGATGQFDWAKKLPYSYQQGSSYGQGGQQQPQMPVSLFQPNQTVQQPAVPAATGTVPQTYNFGSDQSDAASESKDFAQGLGQGVLAASQQAVRQAGMQQRLGKRPGGVGSDPYGSINQGGGWNVGGTSGMDYT